MNTNTNTLFGGRLVKVKLLDGTEAEFKVRQLPLGEYDKAFALVDDEIALVAYICGGHNKAWLDTIAPESYEALYQSAKEVNERGFFAFSRRRTEAAIRQNANHQLAVSAALNDMTEEERRRVMEAGAKAMASASGSASSSAPRPQRT